MAKIQIKSEKITPFGGIFHVRELFSRFLGPVIDKGQHIDDVLPRLDGIRCGMKGTSCPDQLCRALEQLKNTPAE